MKRIGFVTPWYGDAIPGGAEMEVRGLVKHLIAAGIDCEILTTCVERFLSDWSKDYHKPGVTIEGGVLVRRFRVRKRDTAAFDEVNAKLMRGQKITGSEEGIYTREMINSPKLYEYMRLHQADYSLFVFIPYMFGTTYYGCQVCPEKSVLIPCLHDEIYAYMDSFKQVFSKVQGMILNAEPERELAERLYGGYGNHFRTIGIGLDTEFSTNAQRFRDKYRIDTPFILYAGRKEAGKRVDTLAKYFACYKERHPSDLKLVLIGGGEIALPSEEILDLGFVPVQDKYDAYAAASVFCNPSQFESFSLVIMESWLAGTPVLVNGDCAVTRSFVSQSNGGLYYQSYFEFERTVDFLLNHSEITEQMGKNGQSFVQDNFTWDVITKHYLEFFKQIAEAAT